AEPLGDRAIDRGVAAEPAEPPLLESGFVVRVDAQPEIDDGLGPAVRGLHDGHALQLEPEGGRSGVSASVAAAFRRPRASRMSSAVPAVTLAASVTIVRSSSRATIA